METIKIEQKEKWWIATYKTLDIVAQGYTEYEAIRNLLDCIAIHIDYAIDNDNLANLKASKQDVEADAKIKDAIMQIYEGNEVKGLDILCLLVGWIPNGKASQPDVETERINSKTT